MPIDRRRGVPGNARRGTTGRRLGQPPLLPIVGWVHHYRVSDLRHDLVAAVALSALLIPHGMAFAELAGVPAVTGLHTTVVALIAYAVFGPSPLLMVGPDSSLAPSIAAAIALVISGSGTSDPVAAGAMLAVLTGLVCLLAGVVRLGYLAELLSRPVRVGFLNGVAIVMIVGQAAKLLGFDADGGSTPEVFLDTLRGIGDGLVESGSSAIGLGCVAVILVGGVLWSRFPGVLVAVFGATALVMLFGLDDRGVAVLGAVPSGLPSPWIPRLSLSDIGLLVPASVGLALLTLSDTTALSQSFAGHRGERVDANREVVALGLVNCLVGAFRGIPVSASTTRTTVAEASGGRTQLVGVLAAGVVAVLLFAGSALVEQLPSAALAAVVIAAGLRLLDLSTMRWLLSVRPSAFVLACSATAGVVAIGVLEGIVIATILSLGDFIRMVWRPYDAVLARIEGRKGYHDLSRHPGARQIPGLLLFRFDAPLFFANGDHFARRILAEVGRAPRPLHRVVIAADAVSDVDTTGAEILERVLDDLDSEGIELCFAGLKGPVKDQLGRYGLRERIGEARFHPTIGSAIDDHLATFDVDWVDWTDRPDPH